MQVNPNPAAVANKNNTVLIVALIGGFLAIAAIPFIFFAYMMFFIQFPYQKRTAIAQPEIISVKPTT